VPDDLGNASHESSVRRDASQLWRILRLPIRDWPLAIEVGVLFLLAELGLRIVPARELARRMGVPLALNDGPVADPSEASSLVLTRLERRRIIMVRRLSRGIYGSERGCLRRALVLGWLLRHRRPSLRIGVMRMDGGSIAAHAWLEISGVRLELDTGFQPFVH
jgi:hypothetical protein